MFFARKPKEETEDWRRRYNCTHDRTSKAIYVYLTVRTNGVVRCLHLTDNIRVDVDEDGNPVGVEVLYGR